MNPNEKSTQDARTVLLVEDLEDDVFFFKHALKRAGLAARVFVGHDGLQALEYLTNQGQFADATLYPRPDLMFLDLKMPNMNGFEVLEWLNKHPLNPPLKVVVLTGSAEPDDQVRARALGASAYLIKPPAPEKLAVFFAEIHPAQTLREAEEIQARADDQALA